MTDAPARSLSFPGFEPVWGEGGLRFRYEPPAMLEGLFSAELLCRGSLLNDARGAPSVILKRLGVEPREDRVIAPWQVHGTSVLEGRRIWGFPQRPKADGIHLDSAFDPTGAVRGSLRFADCTPIVAASDFPRPWVLMLHSGFKGTLLRFFSVAWSGLRSFYGSLRPERTFVWLGPAVGACCYTRKMSDPLTLRALRTWDADAVFAQNGEAGFDLLRAIEGQARDEGIPAENIYTLKLCTACNSDIFYSYRAGDLDDRMILFAQIL